MAELHTDEEKVEAIKRWWKENGLAVIGGIALGLAGVFGWRAWVGHQENTGQRASLAFEQVLIAADAGALPSVEQQTAALLADYGRSPYAMFAQLALARAQVEAEQLPAAATTLRDAIGQAPDPALARLAALRLARVLIALADTGAAQAVISEHDDGGAFAGEFAALRGDIAAAEGRVDDARTAWQAAIDGGAATARILQLKLDDLAPASGS